MNNASGNATINNPPPVPFVANVAATSVVSGHGESGNDASSFPFFLRQTSANVPPEVASSSATVPSTQLASSASRHADAVHTHTGNARRDAKRSTASADATSGTAVAMSATSLIVSPLNAQATYSADPSAGLSLPSGMPASSTPRAESAENQPVAPSDAANLDASPTTPASNDGQASAQQSGQSATMGLLTPENGWERVAPTPIDAALLTPASTLSAVPEKAPVLTDTPVTVRTFTTQNNTLAAVQSAMSPISASDSSLTLQTPASAGPIPSTMAAMWEQPITPTATTVSSSTGVLPSNPPANQPASVPAPPSTVPDTLSPAPSIPSHSLSSGSTTPIMQVPVLAAHSTIVAGVPVSLAFGLATAAISAADQQTAPTPPSGNPASPIGQAILGEGVVALAGLQASSRQQNGAEMANDSHDDRDADDTKAEILATGAFPGHANHITDMAATPGTAVEPGRIIDQIVNAASQHLNGQQREITLRLDPPELGALHLRVVAQADGTTTAQIQANSAPVRDMLNSRLHELRQSLADAGINIGHCSVSLNMQDRQQTPNRFLEQTTQQGWQTPSPNPGGGTTGESAIQAAPAPRILRGVVDYLA